MKDIISFSLMRITKEDIDNIAELNSLLEKAGIKCNYSLEHNSLHFIIDEKKYEKKTSRGAGRKKDKNKVLRYKMNPTVSEVKFMYKASGNLTKVIEEIGCPRSTFNSYWKKVDQENDYQDNMKFFDL